MFDDLLVRYIVPSETVQLPSSFFVSYCAGVFYNPRFTTFFFNAAREVYHENGVFCMLTTLDMVSNSRTTVLDQI